MEKILVVDDTPDHLETLSAILESSGYEVIKETKAKKVLKIAQDQYPSLIMLDVRMPELTGFEVAKILKSNDVTRNIIILIYSGIEKSGEMFKRALEVGAEDFITMPADNNEITCRVRVCLDRKKYIAELKNTKEALQAAYNELKETQFQLIYAEKMKAVGLLASGVAHEVKNPLGSILLAVNYLEKKLSLKKEISEILNVMKDHIGKADSIVSALLDFSRAKKLDIESADVNSILEDSLNLIQYGFRLESIKVIKEMKEALPKVLVDKAKIEQVFVNVLLNAVQAMPIGGKLFIRSYLTQLNQPKNGVGRRSGDYFKLGEKAVVAEIEDTGVGIPKKHLGRVFDPFFTTRGREQGAGLGLSVTRNIINMHKGLIEIKSEENKGTKVIISLKIGRWK